MEPHGEFVREMIMMLMSLYHEPLVFEALGGFLKSIH